MTGARRSLSIGRGVSLVAALLLVGCQRTEPPAPVVDGRPGVALPGGYVPSSGGFEPNLAASPPEPAGLVPKTAPKPDGKTEVTVRAGQTLYGVARELEVPTRSLIEVNGLQPPYRLVTGQVLKVPQVRQYQVQPGETLYGVARRFNVDPASLARLNKLDPPYGIKSGVALVLPPAVEPLPDAGPIVPVPRPLPTAAPAFAGNVPTSPAFAGTVPVPTGNIPGVRGSGSAPNEARADAITTTSLPPLTPQTVPQTGGGTTGGTTSANGQSVLPSPVRTAPPSQPPTLAPGAAPVKNPPPIVVPTPARPESLEVPGPGSPGPAAANIKSAVKPPEAGDPVPGDGRTRRAVSSGRNAGGGNDAGDEPVSGAPTQDQATPEIEKAANLAAAIAAHHAPSSPIYLLPVRGRVIATFGPTAGGTNNDGINIAAPTGTTVVAAEAGTIAYAGNELKGFGNLLLIRHADGFVTAYAHNQVLLVKVGEKVRRGQPVARVGNTGIGGAPQLHFEMRRGTKPVDPLDHLPGIAGNDG